MLYTSTRGGADLVCSAHAIANGIAADGGLFIPQKFPVLSLESILSFAAMTYAERAATILALFLTDYRAEELQSYTEKAYESGAFDGFQAPLHSVNNKTAVLELWHGPTAAFKDMALQLLPHLMLSAMEKTGEQNNLVILVATSGDTGKAALEGFADVEGTTVFVFYPENGVSYMQKLQMITQEGKNVHVIALKGNFDDAQSAVKAAFADETFIAKLRDKGFSVSSANSINWGRLVPQIVYYFSAYADAVKAGYIKPGEEINVSVPSGNFGNILAAYYAKLMGVPIYKLICASNTNNILTDFLAEGKYDKRRDFHQTISPSMDILISSNLERLLYHITNCDTAKVAAWMKNLKTVGFYEVENSVLQKIQEIFFGAWVDDFETKETIYNLYRDKHYLLDPHSAVAWRAADKYRMMTSDDRFCIVVSTASPYKFNQAVLDALRADDVKQDKDSFSAMELLHELTKTAIPRSLEQLKNKPILHSGVIEKNSIKDEIDRFLGV